MTQLIRYDAARTALAEAHSIDEVKDIRDKSEAMAAYARQAKDVQLVQWATEIKVRAERKAGQMLAEMPKATGSKGTGSNQHEVRSHDATAPKTTLADIGVTKSDSSRWQKLAAVSDDQFEHAVAAAKEVAGEVTTAAMLRAAKSPGDESVPTPKPPKPKLLSEEESARILAENEHLRAENAELRERIDDIAQDCKAAVEENCSMSAVFDADDKLAAAMKEIARQSDDIRVLRERLNGKMNEAVELNRLLRACKTAREKLEKAAGK